MKKLPFFRTIKEAQDYLDALYNLPLYHLVKHYKGNSNIRLVVDNTK
jgi:hypothetical protein